MVTYLQRDAYDSALRRRKSVHEKKKNPHSHLSACLPFHNKWR